MKSRTHLARRRPPAATTYELTDCLHRGRTVHVPADGIACTVSAWLAELGARSPLADELARTVGNGDWTATHAISDLLCVTVAVAA